ncbi:hypothetical protein AVEN_210541-1 [Araneus ventricosus]|uniref:Uncharacterized protein n=1 Tax=Araneus ventricosus TaxID=182803 RepID=A0A4Y2U2Y9_ARAVE|nr:hypothetical protein AVEN_128573-1 [Araneus ventricosus]GBO06030.1 hypothetical protein AVEN_210541-1 [Araneus ventricosus]
MNNYILILGDKPLGINYSLAPTSRRVKKSLSEGERDLLPFFLGETSHRHSLHFFLGPYPLDNVKVWGLAWPVNDEERTSSGCAWISVSDHYPVEK